jgi:hypothetical protein
MTTGSCEGVKSFEIDSESEFPLNLSFISPHVSGNEKFKVKGKINKNL